MPRCVLGVHCQYPLCELSDGHRCRRCHHHVHVLCGHEDPTAALSENLTCFFCTTPPRFSQRNDSVSNEMQSSPQIHDNISPVIPTATTSPLSPADQPSPLLANPTLPSKSSNRRSSNQRTPLLTKRRSAPSKSRAKPKGKVIKDFRLDADITQPDPLLMKPVAFDVDDKKHGTTVYESFGGDDGAKKYLTFRNGRRLLLGTIVRSTNKKKLKNLGPGGSSAPLYDIQWEQSDLGDTPIHLFNLYDAMTLHQTVTTSTKSPRNSTASVHNPNPLSHEQRRILFRVNDAEIGTPEASDDEDGKDNNDDEDQILFPDILHEYATRQNIPQDEDDSEEPFDGSDFCWSTGTLPPPPDRSTRAASFVKPEAAGSFSTPIDSLLAFVPLSVFNSIAFFSNLYAHHVIESSENGNVSGKRWEQDITINEIMKFFGILLKMVLRPTPGQSYPFCWNDAQWHPYTTLMKLRRFQQIRSVLHFNDNSNIDGSKDAAFKVRIKQNQKPSCILLIHSNFPDIRSVLS